MSIIKKINGQEINSVMLENYCKNLNMKDTQALIQGADKFNDKVGMDNSILVTCPNCNTEISTPFRITSEFFGPTI